MNQRIWTREEDEYKKNNFGDKTFSEMAEHIGCSRNTIQSQEQRVLVKMRHPRNTRKLKDFMED